MKIFVVLFFSIILTSALNCCGQKDSILASTPPLSLSYVELDKSTLKFIDAYIYENKLQNVKAIIVLSINSSGSIKNMFVTHTMNIIPKISRKPYLISKFGSKIIFIYTGIEYVIDSKYNSTDLLSIELAKNGYSLNEKYVLEHNPVWWIKDCDDHISILKNLYFETDIPCGYQIEYKNNIPILNKIPK